MARADWYFISAQAADMQQLPAHCFDRPNHDMRPSPALLHLSLRLQ